MGRSSVPALVLLGAVAVAFAVVAAVAAVPAPDDGDPFSCRTSATYTRDGDGGSDLPDDPLLAVTSVQAEGALPAGRVEFAPVPDDASRSRFRVLADGEPGASAVVGDLERHATGWWVVGYGLCRP